MVQYRGGNGRNQEAMEILTALALMGEVILNQRHLKLKENRESNLIAT